MENRPVDVSLNLKKMHLLYQHGQSAIVGLIAIAVVACLSVYLFTGLADISYVTVAVWLTIYLLVSVIRLYGVALFDTINPTPEQSKYWLYAYLTGTLISGLMWGVLVVFLLSTLGQESRNFILFFMEAMISASVATYAASFAAFAVTGITIMSPTVIMFMVSGDPELIITGDLLIIYFLFLVIISIRLTKTIVSYLSMELDIDKLKHEKNFATALNRELEEEIIKRIQAEDLLKEQKYKAEALVNKLFQITSLDGLTGISNRRRFDEYLLNEWKRSARNGTPLSLILCDIDYYKHYNDTYGHLAGDDALKEIANLLEHYSRRAGDLAARYGGEEFAMILPDTTSDKARHIAEELRMSIEELQLPHKSSSISDHVTASFGVATTIPTRHVNVKFLINLADEALYKAKDRGRNCVMTTDKLHVSHAESKVER